MHELQMVDMSKQLVGIVLYKVRFAKISAFFIFFPKIK